MMSPRELFEQLVYQSERTSFPGEAEAARRASERIRIRHGIEESRGIERPDYHPLPRAWTREVAIRIAWSLGLQLYQRRGRGGRRSRALSVHATPSQWAALQHLYEHSAAQLRDWQKRARVLVQSVLAGHLDALYPVPMQGSLCPVCLSNQYPYVGAVKRRVCQACGHRSRIMRPRILDETAYLVGRDSARRALPEPRLDGNRETRELREA